MSAWTNPAADKFQRMFPLAGRKLDPASQVVADVAEHNDVQVDALRQRPAQVGRLASRPVLYLVKAPRRQIAAGVFY